MTGWSIHKERFYLKEELKRCCKKCDAKRIIAIKKKLEELKDVE